MVSYCRPNPRCVYMWMQHTTAPFMGSWRSMKRLRLLLLLVSVSILLLLLQAAVLRRSLRKRSDGWSLRPADPVAVSQANVRDLIILASAHEVPLVPFDPVLLRAISQHSLTSGPCPFLCSEVVSFATFNKFLGQKLDWWSAVQRQGFEVLTIEGANPRLLPHGYRVAVVFHYVLVRWDRAVHIVMVHERASGAWWHAALTINESITSLLETRKIQLVHFATPAQDRVFDRFEVVPVTLWGLKLHLPTNIPSVLQSLSHGHFTECNHTRARLFREQYRTDISTEALEFKSDAWRLLSRAQKLLDSLEVPFWLSSGTCLGFYRQCDIIGYSRDVDLGIWIEDFRPELVSFLSSHGLPLRHIFGRVNDSFELSFQDGDVKLDIFFFYREKEYVWNGGTQARTGRKFKYIFPPFSLCWTEFLELKVRIPCQTEAYIVANYGTNWMVPVRTWDWKQSPPNVRTNGVWPEEDWPQVIQLFPVPGQ